MEALNVLLATHDSMRARKVTFALAKTGIRLIVYRIASEKEVGQLDAGEYTEGRIRGQMISSSPQKSS
ncbi:hypothetical protein PM082_012413 [Marasmius tenuissimus]|nr:hypothetical protein PM082_012413 [Marasmius tenuissimus]